MATFNQTVDAINEIFATLEREKVSASVYNSAIRQVQDFTLQAARREEAKLKAMPFSFLFR